MLHNAGNGSAAIARVRVIAMLSTYSDLEDEGSSDDLDSEVEHADLTSRRQRHQQPDRFSTPTSTRSGRQFAKGPCFTKYETI